MKTARMPVYNPKPRELTPREILVQELVERGFTSTEIAEMIGISPSTVKKMRQAVRNKLSPKEF